jgi:hypothetical protein
MTVTATKMDSSHEIGKNVITRVWPASTTIIYNNPVYLLYYFFYFAALYHFINIKKIKI